jgi:hypothetical protein
MPWPFRTKSEQEVVRQTKEDTKEQALRQKKLEETHPSSRYPATQVLYADPSFEHPPPLNYSLKPRMKSLYIFWFLVFVDCIVTPLVLYFCLWYLTDLSPNAGSYYLYAHSQSFRLTHFAVFSISTAALGTVSIIEYFVRFRRLWRKNSGCRVIGARRYYVCRSLLY